MTPLLRRFLGMNWVLLGIVLALCGFGLISIYSATYMRDDAYLANSWHRQAVWMGVGVAAFLIFSMIDYRWWLRWGAVPLYLLGIGLLLLTRFKGRTVYGAKSWLDLGPVNFQPSQLAIFSTIVVLAICLSEFKRIHPVLRILMAGAIMATPMLLILVQPDLGSAITFMPMFLLLLFVSAIPKRFIVCMILLAVMALPVVTNLLLKDYQRARILTFLDPEMDPLGQGWTIRQSMMAIGSGGWDGKGFRASNTLTELGFLPQTIVHNDFVFSVIGETFGFVGCAALVGGFALLLLTLLYIAYQAEDDLGAYYTVGVAGLLFTHIFMNIGMTIQITPITGLPLPFISYGGTFLLTMMVAVGIVQSVWIYRKPLRA